MRNLRTGATFLGELEPVPDIELNTELGRDSRENILLHVLDRDTAATVFMGDFLEVPAISARIKVLRRVDNPANPQVDFGCMKVTDKDQG